MLAVSSTHVYLLSSDNKRERVEQGMVQWLFLFRVSCGREGDGVGRVQD